MPASKSTKQHEANGLEIGLLRLTVRIHTHKREGKERTKKKRKKIKNGQYTARYASQNNNIKAGCSAPVPIESRRYKR